MFKLILKFQDRIDREFEFEKTPVKIGRRDDNDVIIDNMAVSGHHCQIDLDENGLYIVNDKESLNGTYVNEQKIDHAPIYDGDVIDVGKHTLLFSDLRSDAQRARRPKLVNETPKPASPAIGETQQVKIDKPTETQSAPPEVQTGEVADEDQRPKRVQLFGSITIISGGTPQILDLAKVLTKLGKSEEADIRCSGLLVGKIAAVINKRPNGFHLAYTEGIKKPEVNGEVVTRERQLRDGDEIVIGATRMTFSQRQETS